jgi:hypothetical protein
LNSKKNTDALGVALLAYMSGERNLELLVSSDISEDDVIPVDYLFRTNNEFPELETKALALCKGKVLDVGAGSGCHSLVLKEKGFDVETIDVSEGAVNVMLQRGLVSEQVNFFDVTKKYDTLLFLMNGIGIAGNLKGLKPFLAQSKSLLNSGGQILLDSSDISYMFEDEDGALWMDLNKPYYGEVVYQMQYNKIKTKPFNWLFIDYDRLKEEAMSLGFNVELVLEDENNQYLAKLWL